MLLPESIKSIRPALLIAVLCYSTPSLADGRNPVPDDAMVPSPESLVRFFAGRTEDWGGGSAAFWAPDGTFRAINASEQSVGSGRWYVTTASQMCYEGTWAWRQDFGVQSREVETCNRYMMDSSGQVWTTSESMDGPWFPYFDDNLSSGDNVTVGFDALTSTIGIRFQSEN